MRDSLAKFAYKLQLRMQRCMYDPVFRLSVQVVHFVPPFNKACGQCDFLVKQHEPSAISVVRHRLCGPLAPLSRTTTRQGHARDTTVAAADSPYSLLTAKQASTAFSNHMSERSGMVIESAVAAW